MALERYDINTTVDEIARLRWNKISLAADNVTDYLDHDDAKDLTTAHYYPLGWYSQDRKVRWDLKEIAIQQVRSSFTIPAEQLTGIFFDSRRGYLTLALKDVDAFSDEPNEEPNALPYDRYTFNEREGSYFRICYTTKAGAPFIIHPELIRRIGIHG